MAKLKCEICTNKISKNNKFISELFSNKQKFSLKSHAFVEIFI